MRLLNGSDSRVLDLRVETGTVPGASLAAPLLVIGNELGLLNVPVAVSVLSIAPGERYDVAVDFSGRAGQSFVMTNSANAPYPDGDLVVPGATEIWEFYNTSVDAHPIHMHLADFRILDRRDFDSSVLVAKDMGGGYVGGILDPAKIALSGLATPPGRHEVGKKDTAKMFPGQVTRVLVQFKRPGRYVYHCHILSHEAHEMMRPYRVES